MAITLVEVAKTNAFNHLISTMHYSGGNTTFELLVDGTVVSSFTRISDDWLASGGKLNHDGATLKFIVPVATTGVNGVRLKGTFNVGGTQIVSTWFFTTPENFPNGGTYALSQYEMTASTE